LIEKEGMLNAPTNVDMEKGKIHEVVSEEWSLEERMTDFNT
jgi:hypothetical protein